MPADMDPLLAERIELLATGHARGDTQVELILGLTASVTPVLRQRLQACGLSLRSEIGDVLTGVIRLDDVPVLAALPEVIRIEGSSPVFVEKSTHSSSLPTE